MNHAGRVALVTGGSNGIGQAIALRLAADGARVANLDIAPGGETEALAARAGQAIRSYGVDLADGAAIRAAVARVAAELGPPLILVHAAAVLFTKPFEELQAAEWARVQAVSQDAAFHLSQAALPGMKAAQWGRIILIASSTYWVGGKSMTHYVASKGALIGFAHGLAAEVGDQGVTINCVAPGLTRTAKVAASLPPEFFEQIIAIQSIPRTGRPEDQAGIVSFLASEDAGFITGQSIVVDGGQVRT